MADWYAGLPSGGRRSRSNLSADKIARVLFYIDIRGRMVLLHGFIKKTQKTPQMDLELARKNKRVHETELRGRK